MKTKILNCLLFGLIISMSSFSIAKTLRLSKQIVHKKTIPNKYKHFKNVEHLILRPPILRKTRPQGGGPCIISYKKSHFRQFPDWIKSFKKLKAIDLIGNPLFKYQQELRKLQELDNLEYLAIEKTDLNDSLLNQITRLKSLKELHIKKWHQKKDTTFINQVKKYYLSVKLVSLFMLIMLIMLINISLKSKT